VHRFEGTVNQYTGDGIMALFGAPIAHEDHAQRACWAALHLAEQLKTYSDELRVERGLNFSVRMGVNSGEVIVGKIGDDLRMDYTAQGQTVGLAARMEELAAADRVYLTQYTADLAAGYFELRDLGASRIRGLSEPLHLFELEGVGRLRTRLDVSRARGFSKFVGRADELASLEVALERTRSGSGQVVGIVGEAGLGKSRLCYEFEETCRARGIPVQHAGGVSHGKAIPLLPILELFRQVLGISLRENEREARQKIAGAVLLLDEELREELPLLFDFLGVPDPERPAPALDAEARQRRLLALLKRYSIARSEHEPFVLVFEDLHWIDSATETFVEALADATEGVRTLMVVNFRPEYRSEWMRRSTYQQLALRPLDQSGVDEMLREWLGDDPSLAGLCHRIFKRTEGNPFFIEEVVEGAGNGVTVGSIRARTGKLGIQTRPKPHGPPRQPSTLPGTAGTVSAGTHAPMIRTSSIRASVAVACSTPTTTAPRIASTPSPESPNGASSHCHWSCWPWAHCTCGFGWRSSSSSWAGCPRLESHAAGGRCAQGDSVRFRSENIGDGRAFPPRL
jgi:hypothetical protein